MILPGKVSGGGGPSDDGSGSRRSVRLYFPDSTRLLCDACCVMLDASGGRCRTGWTLKACCETELITKGSEVGRDRVDVVFLPARHHPDAKGVLNVVVASTVPTSSPQVEDDWDLLLNSKGRRRRGVENRPAGKRRSPENRRF